MLKCNKVPLKPTSWFSSVDPVRVDDAGDGEDVCSEEETSWYHGEFIHVCGHSWRSERLLCLYLNLLSLKGNGTFKKSLIVGQLNPHLMPHHPRRSSWRWGAQPRRRGSLPGLMHCLASGCSAASRWDFAKRRSGEFIEIWVCLPQSLNNSPAVKTDLCMQSTYFPSVHEAPRALSSLPPIWTRFLSSGRAQTESAAHVLIKAFLLEFTDISLYRLSFVIWPLLKQLLSSQQV